MIYKEDLYIGSSFLPLACTVIETSALWFAIARGTAKGPTPAIMSATTVDPRYMYVCMYVCMNVCMERMYDKMDFKNRTNISLCSIG